MITPPDEGERVREDPENENPVAGALRTWCERGRIGECLGYLSEWLLSTVPAERLFVFTVGPEGGYRLRVSRNADGESVPDCERWISHFAVRRTLEAGEVSFFPDTRLDRRFRTEGEREHGVRFRSMLAIPLVSRRVQGLIYFDTRFNPIEWNGELDPVLAEVADLLTVWLELDATEQELRTVERRLKRVRKSRSSSTTPARPLVRMAETVDREVDFHGFRTRCPGLIASIEELRRLALSSLAILIEGESGTGKEVLARAVHEASNRAGRFVSLHCGAIPDALTEIELFGHAKGAFTGAERPRSGLIELAEGGTLFLDDVGEMPDEMQNALLRVLETGKYRPVSGMEERHAKLRVISSSLTGPQSDRGYGSIRHDLFFRLAGAKFTIPPLRERGEDIILLARHFFEHHRRPDDPEWVAPEVEAALIAYHWPGNTRELENLIRRVLALGVEEFGLERFEQITGFKPATPVGESSSGTDIKSVIDRAEREVIIRTLKEHGGNKSLAARALGLSRKTLYRRMEKHGIPL